MTKPSGDPRRVPEETIEVAPEVAQTDDAIVGSESGPDGKHHAGLDRAAELQLELFGSADPALGAVRPDLLERRRFSHRDREWNVTQSQEDQRGRRLHRRSPKEQSDEIEVRFVVDGGSDEHRIRVRFGSDGQLESEIS